jgi:hypothetical protein
MFMARGICDKQLTVSATSEINIETNDMGFKQKLRCMEDL